MTGLGKSHKIRKGLTEAYDRIVAELPETSSVALYRWGTVYEIAEDLKEQKPKEVVCAGHSYGVSTLAMVCDLLRKSMSDVVVTDFVSADGVWRESVDSPQFRSLFDGHKIKIPSNVRRLYSFRQTRGILRGHEFETDDGTMVVFDRILAEPRHGTFDRVPAFVDLVVNLALQRVTVPED